jgi:phosphoglucosamine mutase
VAVRFGTDGVRGLANAELTPELVMALGRAAAVVLGGPCVLVGRDTRRSGPLLVAAFSAGVLAEGVDVVDLGVLPTPGVASLSAARSVPGAVVSASHNPFADNGIKLFAAGGRKLDSDLEAAVEAAASRFLTGNRPPGQRSGPQTAVPTGAAVGTAVDDGEGRDRYLDQLVGALQGRRLDGITVVLDCGHGAATVTAPAAFAAAGASVVEVLAARPDGTNINDGCGSTDPSGLCRAVVRRGAALGLAFDGDADRVIAVDGDGRVVDGDRLLALFATDLDQRGRLAGRTVVVTTMTNLGFHRAMRDSGIEVCTTDVGDRHVLAALDRHGWSLGGEQSGHVIFRELATTGDGVLSGLLLADLLVRRGRSLGEAAEAAMRCLPQVLRNVAVARRDGLPDATGVWHEVASVEAELGEDGRVVLRPSGTENLIRVMVEAADRDTASRAAERLVAAVRSELGSD